MAETMLLYAHLTDNELVEKIKRGHIRCFEVLLRRHDRSLYRIGRMYGIPHNDVEDLITDTHLAAYDHLFQYDMRVAFRTWIVRRMINKCTQKAVRAIQQRRSLHQLDSEPASTGTRSIYQYITERLVTNSENGNKLESRIEQLPLSLRAVFVLHEIEGYNITDTAALLSISEETAQLRAGRAKHALRKSMRSWSYYSDVYPFDLSCSERIVNKVMSLVDAEDYEFAKALMPR